MPRSQIKETGQRERERERERERGTEGPSLLMQSVLLLVFVL